MSATAATPQTETIRVEHVLPTEEFVRLAAIIGRERVVRRKDATTGKLVVVHRIFETGVLPMSKSAWLRGVAAGKYPRGVRHGSAVLYRAEDIRALLEKIGAGSV